jgi:hypothetical protein
MWSNYKIIEVGGFQTKAGDGNNTSNHCRYWELGQFGLRKIKLEQVKLLDAKELQNEFT